MKGREDTMAPTASREPSSSLLLSAQGERRGEEGAAGRENSESAKGVISGEEHSHYRKKRAFSKHRESRLMQRRTI